MPYKNYSRVGQGKQKAGEIMDKRQVIAEMKKEADGAIFITQTDVARYFKIQPRRAKRYLQDLESVDGKYYFIPDVAEVFKKRTTV